MKEYCVDFEIAKKLKKYNFPQESLYYYFTGGQDVILEDFGSINYLICSAPSSEELLEYCPYGTTMLKYKINNIWLIENPDVPGMNLTDKKLSNALAKMWLYLNKEGNIK